MKKFDGMLKRNHHVTSARDPEFYGRADFQGERLSIVGNLEQGGLGPMWFLKFHEKQRGLVGQGVLEKVGVAFIGEADLDGNRVIINASLVTDESGEKHFALILNNEGCAPEHASLRKTAPIHTRPGHSQLQHSVIHGFAPESHLK